MSLFGLPGTVVIFADVLVYATFNRFDRVGFKILLFLLILSIIGEMIDFLMGITESLTPVPSKKLFMVSAASAIAGSFILTPFLLGLGTFSGFFLGCFAGIIIMEFIRQSKLQAPFKASNHAIFVMIGGKLAKGCVSLIMIVISLANIYS
ncbi:MAG: DUF456 domain-containing protein [Smithella sp.]